MSQLSERYPNDLEQRNNNNLNTAYNKMALDETTKKSNSFQRTVFHKLPDLNSDDVQSRTSSLKSEGINSPSKSISRDSVNSSYKRLSPSKVTRSASTGDVQREDFTTSSDRTRRVNKTFTGTEARESDLDILRENKISFGFKQGNRNLPFSLPKRNFFKKDISDAGDQSVISGITYSTTGACSASSTKVDIVAIPESRSVSVSPNHSRNSSSTSMNSNYIQCRLSGGTPHKYTFHAPSSGKLGIVIEASDMLGPTIHTVKDYSPLFGKVEKGDKLVEVDGESTVSMSTEEVTTLLAKKRLEKSGRGTIMIKVISATKKNEFLSEPAIHSKNNNNISDGENKQRYEEKKNMNNMNFKPKFSNMIVSPKRQPEQIQQQHSYHRSKDFSDSHSTASLSMHSKTHSTSSKRQPSDLTSSDVNDSYNDEDKSLISSSSTAFDGFHLMGGVDSESVETSEDEEDDSVQFYGAI